MIKSVIIVLLAAFCGCLLWYMARGPWSHKQIDSTITMETLLDSLKAHDVQRDSIIKELRNRYSYDTMRIGSMRKYIDKEPDRIAAIKKQYNEKRNHINTLPPTEQVEYLSDWLPKDTVTR